MADDSSKPSIPAWQRAAQQNVPADIPEEAPTQSTEQQTSQATDGTTIPAASKDEKDAAQTIEDQREQVREFLKDPTIAEASIEQKRAFLESKNVPTDIIDQELASMSERKTLSPNDFEGFKEQSSSALAGTKDEAQDSVSFQAVAPPIITYPEFLSDAHRPTSIITPTGILASTYVASAAAVLLWSASTYLVKPMSASLTEARHEFALHSQEKVTELNSRLEKMVSSIPSAKSTADGKDTSDADSVVSDPAELYHRDVGTQTDIQERAPKVKVHEESAVTGQVKNLTGIQDRLSAILSSLDAQGDINEELQNNVSKLRHQLDTMTYGTAGISVWNQSGTGFGDANGDLKDRAKQSDAIEDLKKEIRGVKGVLLSAKRFPALGQGHTGSATRYSASRRVDAPA